MILGTKARYAVMAMVELAGYAENKPVSLLTLARAQSLDGPYLEQIFSKLRQGGLVQSVRGPGGGYVLARPASEIHIHDIVSAVEEAIAMTRCDKHGSDGCMPTRARCLTHDLWDGLERCIEGYLSSVSLADIRKGAVNHYSGLSHPVSPHILNPES